MADNLAHVDLGGLAGFTRALAIAPEKLRAFTLEAMRYGIPLGANHSRALVTNDVLKVRSGRLRQGISHRVEESGDAILGRIGFLTPGKVPVHGAAHELGTDGPIVPRQATYLTIPLAAAKYPTGVPRFTAREAERIYPGGTFVAKSKAGNLILFGKRRDNFGRGGAADGGDIKIAGAPSRKAARQAGQSEDIVPLFVLKTSVPAIPAKRFLRRGVEEVAVPAVRARLQQRMTTFLFATHGGSTIDY